MKKFSDFNLTDKVLDGDKIKLNDIVGKTIIVKDFKISPSKQKSGTDYLKLQFTFEESEENHVTFTDSTVLIDQIKKIDEQGFEPFETKIKRILNWFY